MSKRKKLIERAKNLVIVALLISAALLLNASGYVSFTGRRSSQETASGGRTGAAEGALTALPVSPAGMVISPAEGSRCAFYYSSEQLTDAFESFAASLAEALGSAGQVRELTRRQWQQRLLGVGVYFDFSCAQPLTLLSALLGSTAGEAGGCSAEAVLLSCTDDGVELCFAGDDGLYYVCSTGVSASAVLSRAESYSADGSYFAFTSDKFPGLDPDTVIFGTHAQPRSVLSENAAGAVEPESLMSSLGMNSYVIRPYTEADGTRVYVESGKTLRIGADGKISFKGGASPGGETEPDEAVLLAASIVQQTLQPVCGDAKLCFAGVSEADGGAYTVRFDYVINGIVTELPDSRSAALVTVSAGEVAKLELQPRRYTLTQETRPLLPMAQAAAIASSCGAGHIWLAYLDSGNSASCEWVTD